MYRIISFLDLLDQADAIDNNIGLDFIDAANKLI